MTFVGGKEQATKKRLKEMSRTAMLRIIRHLIIQKWGIGRKGDFPSKLGPWSGQGSRRKALLGRALFNLRASLPQSWREG